MELQKKADAAEAAALARFLAVRDTFLPCWGTRVDTRLLTARRRPRRLARDRRLR